MSLKYIEKKCGVKKNRLTFNFLNHLTVKQIQLSDCPSREPYPTNLY